MTYNFGSQDALIALKTSFSKLLSKSVFTLDVTGKAKEESREMGRSRPKENTESTVLNGDTPMPALALPCLSPDLLQIPKREMREGN